MAQRMRGNAFILAALMLFSTIAIYFVQPFDAPLTPTLVDEDLSMNSGQQGLDVLFMGNSYTQSNNLDGLVESALQQNSPSANADKLVAGGLRLDQHATRAQTAGHQWNTTLNNGNWDWVILQDQSQVPSFPPTSSQSWQDSKNGAIILDGMIEDQGAETVFLMTWGRRDGDSQNQWRSPDYLTMQAHLDSGYRLYAENVSTPDRPAWIAPAGLAFKHIYDGIVAQGGTPEDSGTLFHDLYTSDGSHPSLSGSYLATCVVYATLTGDDPVGLIGPGGLDATRTLELQQAAAMTVFSNTPNMFYPWMRNTNSVTTFGNGNGSVILHPALDESTTLPHRPGSRADSAELDLTAGAYQKWNNGSNSMLMFTQGSTFNGTTIDAFGQLRLNITGGNLVPGSGIVNRNIVQAVQMAGNYSYDTLRIGCQGQTCGSIRTTGPLRIIANTIVIEQGASINADEVVWGGYGEGGPSIQAANVSSDGAGGGGHGDTGGDGGGPMGGSGGQFYGNGSEPGSSGGNVSSTFNNQTTVDARGGLGGGVIELIARTIIINGTVTADGSQGDDGQRPSTGTGPGGSGAGGGSGGSIVVMANTVDIGFNGLISADGGDGGDGANGAQVGPGTGAHDGGDGGGGGSGGRLMVAYAPNGLTNNGAYHADGGTGGARGWPYGSGSVGVVGGNGNAGFAFTGAFGGWGGAPTYALNGTWMSPLIGREDVLHIGTHFVLTANIPANTSVNGSMRWTVDNQTWSEWSPVNLSGSDVPPFTWMQLQLNLSALNNSTTPRITVIDSSNFHWEAVHDLSLDVSNTPGANPVMYFAGPLGLVDNGSDDAQMGYTDSVLWLPVDAKPVAEGWLHLTPPNFLVDGNVTVSLGGATIMVINSSKIPSYGLTISIPQALLQSNWPSQGTSSSSTGVDWGTLNIRAASSTPYMSSFMMELAAIPYELTLGIGDNGSLLNAMSAHATSISGGWATADFPLFPLTASGDALDEHAITLSNLNITFIDDIAPSVADVTFLVAGTEVTTARFGDLVEIRVRVLVNESDLLVNWHLEGLSTISRWPPASLGNMTWDTVHNAYTAVFDTTVFSVEYGDTMALWIWLEDAVGNQRHPGGVADWYDRVLLRPVYPGLIGSTTSGCMITDGNVCQMEPGDIVTLHAEAEFGRTDLHVRALVFNASNNSAPFEVFMPWDADIKEYHGSYAAWASDFGFLRVEYIAIDPNRNERSWYYWNPLEPRPFVFQIAVVDQTKPIEMSFSVQQQGVAADGWRINASWLQQASDSTNATFTIDGGNPITLPLTEQAEIHPVLSYVALGSSTAAGTGASDENHSQVGLIHRALEEEFGTVRLSNLSQDGGRVLDFRGKWGEINSANPDIVTILPFTDYLSSDTSSWRTNYPKLLDDITSTGAHVFFGDLRIDPDYICHIGSGPGGCYSFYEFEMISEKNLILRDIVSTRPDVTIVPIIDSNAEHPEWIADDGSHPNDLGHAHLAELFLREIRGWLDTRELVQNASVHFDTAGLLPGNHDLELHVIDGANNTASDLALGPDASIYLEADSDILTVHIIHPTDSALLEPRPVLFRVDTGCAIGCTVQLEIEVDGELVHTATANGILEWYEDWEQFGFGQHQVVATVSTPDWVVPIRTATSEFSIVEPPHPEWSTQCASSEHTTSIDDISRFGKMGRLSVTSHTQECIVTNIGEVNGTLQFLGAPSDAESPFDCGPAQPVEVVPLGSIRFECYAEENSTYSGIHALIFEIVRVLPPNHWTGNATEPVHGPVEYRLFLDDPLFEPYDGQTTDDGTGLGGEPDLKSTSGMPGPAKVALFTLLLILIGLLSLTGYNRWKDAQDPYAQPEHEQSLFSIEPPDPFQSAVEEDAEVTGSESPEQEKKRVSSRLGLPDGGQFVQDGGITTYVDADGKQWLKDEDGGFTRL